MHFHDPNSLEHIFAINVGKNNSEIACKNIKLKVAIIDTL